MFTSGKAVFSIGLDTYYNGQYKNDFVKVKINKFYLNSFYYKAHKNSIKKGYLGFCIYSQIFFFYFKFFYGFLRS